MMKRVLLLAIVVIVAAVAVQAQDFESELAREAPELAEHAPNGFLSLNELGVEASPEASFAEIEEHAAPAAEPSLMEVASNANPTTVTPPAPWHRDTANQPVARGEEVTCLDGDCTRATHVQKAKVGTHPNASTKPPPSKLDIALAAVKEEIMVRAKELHQEKLWADKVTGLIDTYQQKLGKVQNNIVSLRVQTKALLRKKKQIQNVQVQNKLRYKLKLAQEDLNRLQKQMEHIAGKENEFSDTERNLKNTMNALKNSLLKLRGQENARLVKEGIDVPLP